MPLRCRRGATMISRALTAVARRPRPPVLVGPADHRVPSGVRQFFSPTAAIAKGERHTERACDRAVRFGRVDRDQPEIPIKVEPAVAVIERSHRIMTHELRHR